MAIGRIREFTFDDGVEVSGDDVSIGDIQNPLVVGNEGIYFDNTSGIPTLSPWMAGVAAYDPHDGTVVVSTSYEGSWVSVGQEISTPVVNKTGSSLVNGAVVYIDGNQGNRPTVAKASASDDIHAQSTLGIVTIADGIDDNATGLITSFGLVRDLDTSLYNEGDQVWLDTTAGEWTTTKPSNTYNHILLGFINIAHATQGEIFVCIRDLTNIVAKYGSLIVDPHGWTTSDNTYTTISVNDLTRVVTLTPVGADVPYFCKGELLRFTGTKTLTVNSTAGKHFICFNCTTQVLEDLGSSFPIAQLLSTHLYVVNVYVDETGAAIINGKERHSVAFLKKDWLYKHTHLSTQYTSGMAPTVTSIDGNGSSNDHARFSVTVGSMDDEDITHTITAKLSADPIYKLYKSAGGYWGRYLSTDSASGVVTTGSGRAAYNPPAGGLIEVTNNNYVLSHLFALNDETFKVILGQAEYATSNAAKLAASTELSALVLQGLAPEEYVAVATFIYQTSNSYANSSKSRIISVDTGVSFIDWRTTKINPVAGTSASNHNNLSGIQGGTGGEYYHLTSSKYSEVTAGTVTTNAGSATLTNKDIDGGTASNTSRLTVPKNTTTNLAGLTRKEATIVYDTDLKKFYGDDGSTLKVIGSGTGTGRKNYIVNPSAADSATTNWNNTGSKFTATRDTSTSIPRETTTGTAFKLVSSGDSADAIYITEAILLDDADLNKKLGIELAINVADSSKYQINVYASATSGGTYTRQTLTTDSSSITYLPALVGTFKSTFDSNSALPYIKFEIRVAAAANLAAYTAYFSDIMVTPDGSVIQGAVVEEWKSCTMTTTGVTSTVNSKYRRVGSAAEFSVKIKATGNATGLVILNMPTGMTIDNSAVPAADSNFGSGSVFDSSAILFYSITSCQNASSNSVIFRCQGELQVSNVDPGPDGFDTNDELFTTFTVPIAEWVGSGTVNLSQNDVEYASNSENLTTAGATASATNTIYGTAGTPILAYAALASANSGTSFPVNFKTAIQPTDVITVEFKNSNGWYNASQWAPFADLGSARYGVRLSVTGSNQVTVAFGNAGLAAYGAATYGALGQSWSAITSFYWRVRKTSAGAAVGFGLATTDSAGLVGTGTQSFAGVKTFTDTTNASNKDTGCAVFEGGIGVEKDVVIGGSFFTSQSLDLNSGYANGDYDISVTNLAVGTFSINNTGKKNILSHDANTNILKMPTIYNNSSGVSANVYVSSSGEMVRATSSARYKRDIADYTKGLEDVNKMRPVSYRTSRSDEFYAGFIAEEIHALGLTEFVDYNEEGRPDALHYANITAILVKSIQELSSKLDAALTRIHDLENK